MVYGKNTKAVVIPSKIDRFFHLGETVIVDFDPKDMEIRIRKEL